MVFSPAYVRLQRIWQSDYGRDAGWSVEFRGVRVAVLLDCHSFDMFRDSYRIVPVENELGIQSELFSDAFWNRFEELTFRNLAFDDSASGAFPAAHRLDADGRLVMRGLYLKARSPNWLDRAVLLFARKDGK